MFDSCFEMMIHQSLLIQTEDDVKKWNVILNPKVVIPILRSNLSTLNIRKKTLLNPNRNQLDLSAELLIYP